MKNWRETVIRPSSSLMDAVKVIDSTNARIALVVDDQERLIGTITDGDIRRGLLKNMDLGSSVISILNKSPILSNIDLDHSVYENLLNSHSLNQLPLVDENNILKGLHLSRELAPETIMPNAVVLMVGGLGSRLGDLTSRCPKPMLKVGGKPILETIVDSLKSDGFRTFYFSVNYMSEVIENYFGDGSKFGIEIKYLREDKRMGTAGSLSLIEEELKDPFVVMNGDLLTSVSFKELVKFHYETNALATMSVREYDFQIPFGVVESEGARIKSICEKPIKKFFVNAGIYVIDPAVIDQIPSNKFFDMPSLFDQLIVDEKITSAFPVREYWRDIGRKEDFEIADVEYQENFR